MAATNEPQTSESPGQYSREDWTDFAHTGPGTLAGRYLRSFWQPVSRVQDVPPGRAKPIRVMSEDFTLYRGESGAPHLIAFRCAHRGTQLSTGWVEGDEIRCFYHGWKYGGAGQCTEQPAEPEPFCNRIKLRSYPVQEYLGLIFAYLGEGEPPEMRRYPEFEEPGIIENGVSTVWPCNFFNRLENSPDPVHLAFVHRSSPFTDSGLIGIPSVAGEETEYGIEIRAQRGSDKVRYTHFHMPNTNMISNSDTEGLAGLSLNLSWRIPIDDEHTISFAATYIPVTGEEAENYRGRRRGQRQGGGTPMSDLADSVLRGDSAIDDHVGHGAIVNIEDYVAQVGQGAIAPRELDHLGQSDHLVALLRRLWERDMRNLAEGRPRKSWLRTQKVTVDYGA